MLVAAADPNWFYSTLTQSTAALVGLAGAFMVQALLRQREEVGPARQTIRQRAISIAKLLRTFETELEETRDVFAELTREYASGPETRPTLLPPSATFLSAQGGRSGQVGLPLRDDWDAALVELADRGRDMEQARKAVEGLSWQVVADELRKFGGLRPTGINWFDERDGHQPNAVPGDIWLQIAEQRRIAAGRWAAVRGEAAECGADLSSLRSRLAPTTMYLLLAIMVGLLLSGVIAPLIFLTGESGPSKWLLFGVFTILALFFVGFYGVELRRLRRADRLFEEIF